jgi:NDP-sugar pyrophosphorylase family protein
MKAMILAAGLGTRLRPLTDHRPKALVELAGRTLLEITLSRLRAFGVSEVIINVHHFADMVVGYLKSNNNFGMRIEISREEVLLDTGGGLKKAAWFFLEDPQRPPSSNIEAASNRVEPFLLHNVDVISNIDLSRILQLHKENRALATLAVQSRDSSRLLLFNDQLQLCGRTVRGQQPELVRGDLTNASREATASPSAEKKASSVIPSEARNLLLPRQGTASEPAEKASGTAVPGWGPQATRPLQPLAFSGIHVISPRLLPMIGEDGVFSIIRTYLRLAAQGQKILAFRADNYYWRDLGRPSDLSQAALDLQQKVLLQ